MRTLDSKREMRVKSASNKERNKLRKCKKEREEKKTAKKVLALNKTENRKLKLPHYGKYSKWGGREGRYL